MILWASVHSDLNNLLKGDCWSDLKNNPEDSEGNVYSSTLDLIKNCEHANKPPNISSSHIKGEKSLSKQNGM